MLPIINLDDEEYEEIVKRSKKMIPSVLPEWTDYNEHDPGITFIELFAWLHEMQQYYLDQISESNYLKYLKLLGMKQNPKRPANVYVAVKKTEQKRFLPMGSRAYAKTIPFETVKEEFISQVSIQKISSKKEEQSTEKKYNSKEKKLNTEEKYNSKEEKHSTKEKYNLKEEAYNTLEGESELLYSKWSFKPFGQNPAKGSEFLIFFNEALEEGIRYSIDFELYSDYPVKRNPIIPEKFHPLAIISYEYFDGKIFRPFTVLEDKTYQMLQSGVFSFILPTRMQPKDGEYFLRFQIQACDYEVAPILQGIHFNTIEMVQKETLIESVDTEAKCRKDHTYSFAASTALSEIGNHEIYLYEKEGYRRLEEFIVSKDEYGRMIFTIEYPLPDCKNYKNTETLQVKLVNYQKEQAKIHEIGTGNGFPNQVIELEDRLLLKEVFELFIEEEQSNYYTTWKQVEDFDCSTPEDRHYILLEEQGKIIFGNGIQGRMPYGKILINSYVRSLGIKGNIMPNKIHEIITRDNTIPVTNTLNAVGGCDAEPLEACFLRFQTEHKKPERAVTYEDYERIVKNTSGLMIHKVKALSILQIKQQNKKKDDTCIFLVVEPFLLEKRRRLGNLFYENIKRNLEECRIIGTHFEILPPEYIPIHLYAEVMVHVQYAHPTNYLKAACQSYFETEVCEFGCSVSYSGVYGMLDTLPCVERITLLILNTKGKKTHKNRNGDILLPANGLAYLNEIEFKINYKE